jgi:hypothetical protein
MEFVKPEDCYCAGWYRGPAEVAPAEGHHSECPVPHQEQRHAALLATITGQDAEPDDTGLTLDTSGVVLPSAASFAQTDPDPEDDEDLRAFPVDDESAEICENCGADVLPTDKQCDNCGAWQQRAIEGTHWREHKRRKTENRLETSSAIISTAPSSVAMTKGSRSVIRELRGGPGARMKM